MARLRITKLALTIGLPTRSGTSRVRKKCHLKARGTSLFAHLWGTGGCRDAGMPPLVAWQQTGAGAEGLADG